MAANEGMTATLAIGLGIIFMLVQGIASASHVTSLEVEVPPHAERYTNQTLKCKYEIGSEEKLYAVKWYHNDAEFLMYYPNEPIQIFNVSGVEVIESESSAEKIVLKEVDLSAAGEYKCEVHLEWPDFINTNKASNMTVVVIPQEQPNIEGDVGGHYSVGDRVHLNCTAAPSTPPASLVWLINDKEAPENYLRHYEHRKAADGLLVSNLGLNFKLSKSDFINGELKLKCTATIATLYQSSDEHSQQDPTAAVKEVRERPPAEGSLVTSTGTSGSNSLWTFPIQQLLGLRVLAVLLCVHLLW